MSNEQAIAYFRQMPKKKQENPHWSFSEENGVVTKQGDPLALELCTELLKTVRGYFRAVYDSFHTEAQVLVVTEEDAEKLRALCLPTLGRFFFQYGTAEVFVLPQTNTPVNSIISEAFWQTKIVENQIVPLARIHSHTVVDAYQSATDYSTLNSNSLEMVLGRIDKEPLFVAYWLDEHGKDTKRNVYQALQQGEKKFLIHKIKSGYGDENDV